MDFKQNIIKTMKRESEAIENLICNFKEEYNEVAEIIFNCRGKVIFLGVGKSGHIGKKLAASFASLGIPSFFVHATESVHGDLGMIEERDILILISNSGNTSEVVNVIPYVRKIGSKTIAFTGNKDSILAKECDYKLIYDKPIEADGNNLAPTSSTTVALVIGDAIACAVSEAKNFTKDDFHKFHPGGSLGKSLENKGM
ncbi:SIS domain-containing protein [Clostridium sp. KNHs214]|uniref:KpsF/GutQ family sugar-phosphate isomerase n=1 Tax=Clostridium sp. KNHs214 TaxID=1540257 RepID=UPI000551D3B3|nr:SIS domain-containing protein [Clostridium sp. KNHs214]